MMLIDKGYYDYDFEYVKKAQPQLLWEDTVKTEAQTKSLLARFGIAIETKQDDMSIEELQQYVMNENSKNE